ncbi:MAG: chaperone SurA [SAR86 cluster bacterium SAR86B]|uniref:Chaperone SurA n=1 Tax=SAR86 cluster bacterium SAR86B TaxID=1123867 RepID=J5KHU8_9GAMM|nr:MAG: chaperone SurA [SAR86 cluster bacterium SAR86B]
MKKIKYYFLLLPLVVNAEIKLLDRIAVIVDDGVIMESQIKSQTAEILEQYKNQNINPPSKEILREEIIEKLVLDELQLQMATRVGIRISDAELNQTFIRIASGNNMELEEFIDYLRSQGTSYENLRENIRRQMLIQRVQQGRVSSEVSITDKEFEGFLQTDDSIKSLEPEIQLGQILVKTKEEANEILLKLDSGEDFQQLAINFSKSSSARNGGLLDWKRPSEMAELFANAVDGKDKNWISKPLESGAGFHIIKLIDKRGELVEFEDQWQVRHILMIPSAIRTDEETYEEITSIRERFIDGESFEDLAKEFSEDPGTSSNGGDLGWSGKGRYAPEFEATMLLTAVGETSEVFETQFGYHFLQVIDKRNKDITNDLIENRAYNMLFSRKYDEALENTLRSMRAEAFVEIKELD